MERACRQAALEPPENTSISRLSVMVCVHAQAPKQAPCSGKREASTKLLINSSHQARESISRGREKCSVLENEAEKISHFQEHRLSILYQTAC